MDFDYNTWKCIFISKAYLLKLFYNLMPKETVIWLQYISRRQWNETNTLKHKLAV